MIGVRSIEHYLIQYAEKLIRGLGKEAGMSRRRLREHLHDNLALWRRTYGDNAANAVEAAIRAAWKAEA